MEVSTAPTFKPTEGGFKNTSETKEFVPKDKVANTLEQFPGMDELDAPAK
jgi:hypothetical protein